MRDVWRNQVLFWAVITGFVTIFPIVSVSYRISKDAALSYPNPAGLYPSDQHRRIQALAHRLGVGHRLHRFYHFHEHSGSVEIREAGLLSQGR